MLSIDNSLLLTHEVVQDMARDMTTPIVILKDRAPFEVNGHDPP